MSIPTSESGYLEAAASMQKLPARLKGELTAECPSNIALVKYWGKQHVQIPMNPSLSFTLSTAITRLSFRFEIMKSPQAGFVDFAFNGMPDEAFAKRIRNYLASVTRFMPFLNRMGILVHSENTFPHSSGIASSASSFGALALALCAIENALYGSLESPELYFRKASFLARLGSGSACRSVYGGYSLWGRSQGIEESSDEYAVPVNQLVAPVFMTLHDSILIISSSPKEVSSSEGHQLMEDHPYRSARISQANNHLRQLLDHLHVGNFEMAGSIAEQEALSLHALMMASKKGYMLLKPNTLSAISAIRRFRTQNDIPIAFTLDAGANIHLLHPASCAPSVSKFIRDELTPFCEDGKVIQDTVGPGPQIPVVNWLG